MLKRGVYREIDEDTYHNDPAPEPSLNQSTAKILLERSPRHAWHQHPRLNPQHSREEDSKYDIGNVGHRLLLGKGRDVSILDFADFRTKLAQTQRDSVRSTGCIPVLRHHYERAIEMRDAALRQLREAGIDWLPETAPQALTECGFIWDEGGTWFRTKLDRLQPGYAMDYKTTGMAATNHAIDNKMIEDGWHIQAAMHERALAVLQPERGPTRFLFVVQETYPPFALTVNEISEAALTIGRQQLSVAIETWRKCMRTKNWPSYNDSGIRRLTCPSWAVQQWETRVHGAPVAAE